MNNAVLILVLAIVGVFLFFAAMGVLFGITWCTRHLERCPNCGQRGGLRDRGGSLDSRMTPQGERYPGHTSIQHCEACDWIIVFDSETGTRCISPEDKEEWQSWCDEFLF